MEDYYEVVIHARTKQVYRVSIVEGERFQEYINTPSRLRWMLIDNCQDTIWIPLSVIENYVIEFNKKTK